MCHFTDRESLADPAQISLLHRMHDCVPIAGITGKMRRAHKADEA